MRKFPKAAKSISERRMRSLRRDEREDLGVLILLTRSEITEVDASLLDSYLLLPPSQV